MAHDTFDLDIPRPPQADPPDIPEILPDPPPAAAPRNRGRQVMLAGVTGACVLGAGLGLWARPAEGERQLIPQGSRPKVVAAEPTRQIQIVLDETPAPMGPPMEVMRAAEGATISIAPSLAEPEPIAPVRPPAGLVRVLTTPLPLETADLPAAPPAPRVAEPRKVEAPRVETRRAKADKPEPKKKAEARAERKKDGERTTESTTAKAAKSEGKLAKRKPESDRKAKLAKASKTEKAKKKVRLAEADKDEPAKSKKKTTAKSEGKTPSRLASAVKKAIHKTPKSELAEKSAKLKLADARKAEKAKADKLKGDRAKARVEKAEAAPPRKAPQPLKGGGPLRMVSNRCASTDPGAALVCADAALGAAERRLNRAYQRAEAAGVSASELRRQQQRWLAARAAAAREAPWAVQDVYQARIAELEDMTRGAARGY